MRDTKNQKRPTKKPIEPAGRPVINLYAWLRALAEAADLPIGVRLIGMRIGLHRHRITGQCNPGYVTLCKKLNVDRRTVIRAVATLENKRWFVVSRSKGGPHNNSNEYELHLPPVASEPPVGVAPAPPVRVAENAGDGWQETHGTGGTSVTQRERRNREGEETDRRGSGPPGRFADDDKETLPGDKWVAEVGRRYAAKRRGDG